MPPRDKNWVLNRKRSAAVGASIAPNSLRTNSLHGNTNMAILLHKAIVLSPEKHGHHTAPYLSPRDYFPFRFQSQQFSARPWCSGHQMSFLRDFRCQNFLLRNFRTRCSSPSEFVHQAVRGVGGPSVRLQL